MKHGSLFSGIGGFDLAASWMGWTNVFQVEIDEYCNKVLEKHFPNVKRHRDIFEFDGTRYRGSVDIISGGFPCQPFSQAGKRKGTADDRYLWPEMLRVIREIQPAFVVGENVAGLISMENGRTLERIFADLENAGYRLEVFVIPACAVGAWHRRDRIWIVAYCNSRGWGTDKNGQIHRRRISDTFGNGNSEDAGEVRIASDTDKEGLQGHGKHGECTGKCPAWGICPEQIGSTWAVEPPVGRVVNGVPGRVDRLKALGNAIVPQVAYEIFKVIDEL